jgi:hypothetical protein
MLEAVIIGLVVGWITRRVIKSYEKDSTTTKIKPKAKKLSQEDEELITAILPVINSKN